MKAYVNDLRERVVVAVRAGETTRAVAARFDGTVSSVITWPQRLRETGRVAPGKLGGHRQLILTVFAPSSSQRSPPPLLCRSGACRLNWSNAG